MAEDFMRANFGRDLTCVMLEEILFVRKYRCQLTSNDWSGSWKSDAEVCEWNTSLFILLFFAELFHTYTPHLLDSDSDLRQATIAKVLRVVIDGMTQQADVSSSAVLEVLFKFFRDSKSVDLQLQSPNHWRHANVVCVGTQRAAWRASTWCLPRTRWCVALRATVDGSCVSSAKTSPTRCCMPGSTNPAKIWKYISCHCQFSPVHRL